MQANLEALRKCKPHIFDLFQHSQTKAVEDEERGVVRHTIYMYELMKKCKEHRIPCPSYERLVLTRSRKELTDYGAPILGQLSGKCKLDNFVRRAINTRASSDEKKRVAEYIASRYAKAESLIDSLPVPDGWFRAKLNGNYSAGFP